MGKRRPTPDYAPPKEDFDKEDRRPMMGRLQAAVSAMFSPGGGLNQDPREHYYEDTFNDFPWKCSFGTHEEVRGQMS
jgi:hypothetical protein